MAGEHFTAADFDVGVIGQINKFTALEFTQDVICRHMPEMSQVFNRIIPTVRVVFITVNGDFHFVVFFFVTDENFTPMNLNPSIVFQRVVLAALNLDQRFIGRD